MIYVNGPRVLPTVFGVSCPIVFHVHTNVRGMYARKPMEWTLRAAGAPVIAVSQYIADGYLPVLGGHKVRVIYSGIPDFGGRTRGFSERPVRIGILGRIAPDKGQLDFVRAAREIAHNSGGAEFFIYGERMFAEARYDTQVRALAENSPVTFCGWTNDVGDVLRGLDILAVPSALNEPAPRVVMEALSAGTPVVAYRSGGIPELVEHGRTGILTDSPDSSSLARSIQCLMDDPDLMERLSEAGRVEWRRRFRVERYRKDICDLLEEYARSAGGEAGCTGSSRSRLRTESEP
jgi:glycosyltransferase involved in cell wall biosynthesis